MAKKATRESYGSALAEYGADKNIVVLDADLSKSTKTDNFKKLYPERFINVGIAEGNMMSVAAGLASTGKIVFASSFAILNISFFSSIVFNFSKIIILSIDRFTRILPFCLRI